jgi:hypothetical protein
MVSMSEDEKFDRWIGDVARTYNAPPAAVPRDAMWDAIRAASAEMPGRPYESGSPGDLVLRPVRTVPRAAPHWWQLAAAAVLLVGVGIGIGRFLPSSAVGPNAPLPTVAAAPERPDAAARSARSESYDMVAVRHLSISESLLTSFRRVPIDAVDASLQSWARDLLVDTRLLLDSPAATDINRRRLFQDLELVLAEIVQLPAESSADRSLVHRSIDRGAVLSRIRTSIPAGSTSGT